MNWRGSVAVVTGASSGIGAATARKLAHEGLRVALVARREARLQDVASQIEASGGEALVVPADLIQEADRLSAVQQVRKTWGPTDVLINNAGFGWYGYAWQMPWSVAHPMMQINMTAVTHLTLLFLAEMRERNRGAIVNVSSMVGDMGIQGVALYGATKSFIDAFSTTLYRELRRTAVRVSAVKPGPVSSEFFDVSARSPGGSHIPAERYAITPEAVAASIWRVLQRPRRVVYVPRWLWIVPMVEFYFGWLLDLIGPVLLQRSA